MVAVDDSGYQVDELTGILNLEVAGTATGQRVTVAADRLPGVNHAYLHLKYDETEVHPTGMHLPAELADQAVFLGITRIPGTVALGLATIGGEPTLHGDVALAEVNFTYGPWRGDRTASAVTDSTVADLHFVGETNGLAWSYASVGDYDQNSEVNVADVTPIGIHFRATPVSPTWPAAQVADGDQNDEVNIADLTPIGVHFLMKVTGYLVKAGPTAEGPFAAITGGDVAFGDGVEPVGGGYRQFSKQVTAAVEGAWYTVFALDGEQEAAERSNAVQFGGGQALNPPRELSAWSVGGNIRLGWSAPVSGTPQGYDAFLSVDPQMSGAFPLNGTLISGLVYDVNEAFSPANEYYFAVTARYAAGNSAYSNIFHYDPGAEGDPPEWDVAGTGIRSATPGDEQVAIEWYEATDSESPPVTYLVFYAESSNGIDWGTPQDTAAADATTMAISDLTNGTSYDFGVRARDAIGNTTANTNAIAATPGGGADIVPPVWQGGEGIKTVAPDDTFVTVEWFPALDADSPPVWFLLYYVEESQDFDWGSPVDVYEGAITSTNVLGLENGQRYKFAVRARDSADPPNDTTNTNFLYATPMVFPPTGQLGEILASDVASVRMPGEEIPRIVAVNHTAELWYCVWSAGAWQITDLNLTLVNPDRKYHPQMVGVGDDVHILYGTQNGVFEFHGEKDANPITWTQKTIAGSGVNSVYGIGFDYLEADDYFACVYATNNMGEKLYYSERNADGNWTTPAALFDGNPEIWQCDLALSEYDGSQWAVAAVGSADSGSDDLKFWYATRDNRLSPTWTVLNTGYGGDVMVVEIDPTIHQPVVVCAEVRVVNTDYGPVPVSDATVFTWDGSTWLKTVLEQGDVIINLSEFSMETILTGQDPQLVFSQTGKAVALWSNLDFTAWILDDTAQMYGDWRFSQRPETTWSIPSSMLLHITSSNSVTAGEGYQHCVTCDLGVVDSGGYSELANKYAQRNDYVAGDLWYHRQTW